MCVWDLLTTRLVDRPVTHAAASSAPAVTGNLIAFGVAACFEIAGCFAFRAWLRRGAS
jgi:hypothetical protein